MNPHHAQIKRASVIDFNEIKADIEESIERAHIDVGAAVLNREPKSQEEIDEERASLRSLLVQIRAIENKAKREPELYLNSYDIPDVIAYKCHINRHSDCLYAIFHDRLYQCSGPYATDELKLLVIEEFDRERLYFERLRHLHNGTYQTAAQNGRVRIPERVRIAVWRRDGGKCARCGSREKLEFDHIVPVSRGGSNTVRNIELLCEKCNKRKGKSIQ